MSKDVQTTTKNGAAEEEQLAKLTDEELVKLTPAQKKERGLKLFALITETGARIAKHEAQIAAIEGKRSDLIRELATMTRTDRVTEPGGRVWLIRARKPKGSPDGTPQKYTMTPEGGEESFTL